MAGPQDMKNNANGFSLIELLIVIVIIGILAALSAAGFLASKRSANEGSMVSTLRVLHGAQMTYASSFGFGEFAGGTGVGTLVGLNTLHGLGLVDSVLGGGTKSGYMLVGAREVSSSAVPAQFFFSGIPLSPDPLIGSGSHRFGISTDGIIRWDNTLTDHYANVAECVAAPPMGL